jgi:hypothetical protein
MERALGDDRLFSLPTLGFRRLQRRSGRAAPGFLYPLMSVPAND